MNGYGQFCAVARSLEVLGERWTLLITRELLMGATTFTEILRGLPRIPRATLATRLRALRKAGIVDAEGERYTLTAAGVSLAPVMKELAAWATLNDHTPLTDDHLDTGSLVWDMRRRINRAALPARNVVLAIEFTDRTPIDRHFWLHLSRSDVNLCREDTGAPVDVWLATPTAEATRWWLGELSWAELLRSPQARVRGERALIRQMHHWFLRYVFAAQEPEAATATDPQT